MTPVVPIRPGELGIDVVADATGRTRTTGLRQRYPQRVTTALRCESGRLGAVTLCVQSPSGGAFSDDDLRTTVRCHPGAYLHLTTQAATQVSHVVRCRETAHLIVAVGPNHQMVRRDPAQ